MPTINRPIKFRAGSSGLDLKREIPYDYRRAVGAWIRELRHKAELRQVDVADVIGTDSSWVSAMETGLRSIPPASYEALADLFGVSHDEFAKIMLRHSNPWIYAMLYGSDRKLREEISSMAPRAG